MPPGPCWRRTTIGGVPRSRKSSPLAWRRRTSVIPQPWQHFFRRAIPLFCKERTAPPASPSLRFTSSTRRIARSWSNDKALQERRETDASKTGSGEFLAIVLCLGVGRAFTIRHEFAEKPPRVLASIQLLVKRTKQKL